MVAHKDKIAATKLMFKKVYGVTKLKSRPGPGWGGGVLNGIGVKTEFEITFMFRKISKKE